MILKIFVKFLIVKFDLVLVLNKGNGSWIFDLMFIYNKIREDLHMDVATVELASLLTVA